MGNLGELMSRTARVTLFVLLALVALSPPARSSDPTTTSAVEPPRIAPWSQDPVLDRLLEQERYTEAMDHAMAQLGDRAGRLGPMAIETLVSLEWAGQAAHRSGDFGVSDALLDAVVKGYLGILRPDDPRLAPALITRCRIARVREERDKAWLLLQQARQLLDRTGPEWAAVRASLDKAEGSWIRKVDMEAAISLYQRSLSRQHEDGRVSFEEADTLIWIGWMLGKRGRYEEAESYLVRARRALRSLGLVGHGLDGVIANAFAERLALQGRWREADAEYRRAAEIFLASRKRHPPGFARRLFPLDGFAELAFIALRQGRTDEAWVSLQRSRAAVHLDFARLGLWQELDAGGFRQAQALRSELLSLHLDLQKSTPDGGLPWTTDTWRSVLRSLELHSRLKSLEARFLESSPIPEPSLERARSMLDDGTALLGVLEMPIGPDTAGGRHMNDGWLYVMRRKGPVVWIPLPRPAASDAARFRQAWERMNRAAYWPLHVDADPEVTEDQRVWAARYFDPALPWLQGVRRLVIEGSLVPYDALVDAHGRLVGEAFDVSYVPSAHVASLLSDRWVRKAKGGELRSVLTISAAPPAGEPAVVMKTALASGTWRDLRNARMSFMREETTLDMLPALHYAGAEAAAVAGKFPHAVVLHGPEDVETRLGALASDGSLSHFDVVHFAGHSLSDGQPERAGLVVAERTRAARSGTDGILDVEEILLGWNLDAELLTLSGCETARAAGAERGEMLGFIPALFASGARNVLSSLWPVDDRATALLMDRFYENITGRYADVRLGSSGVSMPLAQGLREARTYVRELADETGRRPFEHPVYWAGFVLMGMPRQSAAATSRAVAAPSPQTPHPASPDH